MNLYSLGRGICRRAILAGGLVACCIWSYALLRAQEEAAPMYLLDWVDVPKSSTLPQRLREQLNRVTDFFVRVTSPDVPRESRRLWRIGAAGEGNCLLTTDTGVRYPKWGSAGNVLYMVEADTNGDGRIDFEDEFVIRVVSSAGGVGTTVGQGRSAVWSPDGKYIAFVTQGQVKLTTPAGGMVPQGSATPPGRLILASGRSPDTAHDFWALDSQKSAAEKEELPDDLRKKYLWLGAMSPSGSEVVFVNTTRTSLLLMETANPTSSRVLLHADFHLMDPAWSPDGRRFVYVSESASNKPFCD